MTPDIRLEFRLNVKAGRRRSAWHSCRRVTRRTRIWSAVRCPAPTTCSSACSTATRRCRTCRASRSPAVQRDGASATRRAGGASSSCQTPQRRRRIDEERCDARGRSSPTLVRRAFRRAPTSADLDVDARASTSRSGTGPAASTRHRDGAAPDPGGPGIHLPLRAGAGRRRGERRRIASATPSWRRACRSSCGPRSRTTSC